MAGHGVRHLPVVDVKRRTVRELVERKARHAPIMANRILSRISAMLTFAMEQDWIESNPAWRIRQPGEERRRRAEGGFLNRSQ